MMCEIKNRSKILDYELNGRFKLKALELKALVFSTFLGYTIAASAQTTASIQSSARPFGLSIVDTVKVGGSDSAAASFQQNVLPGINSLVNVNLGERVPVNYASLSLDPSKLLLNTAADVRVYFVGEGAGYHNTLGFNTSGGGITSGNPQLIFPNASSSISTVGGSSGGRSYSLPLIPGDFVNLGSFSSGTKLNFFLISNGANGGRNVFSTDASINPDKISHVVAFSYAMKGSPYLIIGFEDLYGGGDKDFNDLIFAIDIGKANVDMLTGAPEPALALSIVSMVGLVAYIKRRQDKLVL